jgi:hypothetical protein
LIFDAAGAEEAGFADLGQYCFTNPVGEVFGFGFIRETGCVDEIDISLAFYGDEFYHNKPVFRHVFESHT